jgi:hypothetical protein
MKNTLSQRDVPGTSGEGMGGSVGRDVPGTMGRSVGRDVGTSGEGDGRECGQSTHGLLVILD